MAGLAGQGRTLRIVRGRGSRGVAQLGRALRSGRRGRRFKSCRPDIHFPAVVSRRLVEGAGLFSNFNPAPGACFASPSKSAVTTVTITSAPSTCCSPCSTSATRRSWRALDADGIDASDVHAEVRRALGTGDDRLWEGILVTPRVRQASSRWPRTRRRPRDRADRPLRGAAPEGGSPAAEILRRAGEAKHRPGAGVRQSRGAASARDRFGLIDHYGYVGLFVALALGNVGAPVGTEIVLPVAGGLTATGHLANVWLTIAVSPSPANSAGGSIAYAIGRYGGVPFVEKFGKYVGLPHDISSRVHGFFERYGTFTIFICRFLAGASAASRASRPALAQMNLALLLPLDVSRAR